MRSFVVFGPGFASGEAAEASLLVAPTRVAIDGVSVDCALIEQQRPELEPSSADVLVRKHAFSCNYRDKAIFLRALKTIPPDRCISTGSDFVGTVVEAGAAASGLSVGDRVVPDAHYVLGDGPPRGVPTNRASREYEVLKASQLHKVPDAIPDDAASALTICGQTAYAMIRRIGIETGMRVLVTAASSNTSLFVIEALRGRDIDLCALTSSPAHRERLHAMGVRDVVVVDRSLAPLTTHARVAEGGPFDRVIDTCGDVYLPRVLPLMAFRGRYITCGVLRQYPHDGPDDGDPAALRDVLPLVMMHNLEILGNCIGRTTDLSEVLSDCAAGRFRVPVDSVWSGDNCGRFLARTFVDADRFGKVVYRYD